MTVQFASESFVWTSFKTKLSLSGPESWAAVECGARRPRTDRPKSPAEIGTATGRGRDEVRTHKGRNSVRAALLAGCLGSIAVSAPALGQAADGQSEPAPGAT